jgi:TolA-binding protein
MYGGVSGQNWLGPMMLLVICGLVVGLALVGSDLINPISSWAETQRYQSETQRIDEQNAVDVTQYEVLREAQTQAEIRRLNEEIAQQEQLYQAELQRLSEERQQQKRMNEEEIRQAQKMAALKLKLVNIATIIVASSVGVSLIILSFGVTRRLWRKPTPSPRLVQASLRPQQQQPLSQTWRTVSHQHSVQKDNDGGSHNKVPTP